jgi:transcriptional regulator with XRE-family HTH domain
MSELRRLRQKAGLNGESLARALDFSPSKISRLENGESGIYLADLEKLLDFYRVTKRKRTELLDLARHAHERNWLRMANPALPGDWQTWADFEAEANGLLNYEPLMIPGLLQTPEYARAIIRGTGLRLTDHQVEARVADRMSRQSTLSRGQPMRLHAIIGESALTLPFGDRGDQERQVRHLMGLVGKANVTIQVLPANAGPHAGLNGPFVLLQYDDEASLVLLENRVSSMFLDEEEHLATYETAWAGLAKLALNETRSLTFLRTFADQLSR